MLNGIIAPLAFTGLAEYPLTLVGACFLMPPIAHYWPDAKSALAPLKPFARAALARLGIRSAPGEGPLPGLIPDALAALLTLALATVLFRFAGRHELPSEMHRLAVVAGAPALLCFLRSERASRFGLCVAAVFLVAGLAPGGSGQRLHAERTFFGTHRIVRLAVPPGGDRPAAGLNVLFHGTTVHGKQHVDPEDGRPTDPEQPLAYYHREGPAGRFFAAYPPGRFPRLALVGVGAGALFAYANPGAEVTCFELDPVVRRIAEDPKWFTYVEAARHRGVRAGFVMGDARRTLARAADSSFDLLVLDAFGSDAVPVHLLTAEAGALYLGRIAADGLLLAHISNRHLDFRPVLAGLADRLGLHAAVCTDRPRESGPPLLADHQASQWVVLARRAEDLAPLRPGAEDSPWRRLRPSPGFRVWTDDYSNLFGAFLWGASVTSSR
jgi:hypothetical protein